MRTDRPSHSVRPFQFERGYTRYSPGSVLVTFGHTKVLVSATIDEKVPPFLRNSGKGWLTAEYSMLPSATHSRTYREVSNGRVSGRTNEIQRLIGRSLRSIMDFSKLGERTILIDADVIQADGGTRTSAICGGMVALYDAVSHLLSNGKIKHSPIRQFLGATSVGIVKGQPVVDLCYEEDSTAEVDMNLIMTDTGEFVEIQGTAEQRPFNRDQLTSLLDIGQTAIYSIITGMKSTLGIG